MRLEVYFILIASPWILGESIDNDNKTVIERTNDVYLDETRRESSNELIDNDNKTVIERTKDVYLDETRRESSNELGDRFDVTFLPLGDNNTSNDKIEERTESEINATTDDQYGSQTIENIQNVNPVSDKENILISRNSLRQSTGSSGVCENAQFLISILTKIIPLLKNDIPEKSRTSYVLEILKDLLKTSPEMTQDYEVMYKINDLMKSLEKYHVDGLDSQNALRISTNPLQNSIGAKSNVIFKYEMPHFQNSKCTAELLMIVKVVQEAIMRLVNNPLCTSEIDTTSIPFLTNVDILMKNRNINSPFLPSLYPFNVGANYMDIIYKNIKPNLDLPYVSYESFPTTNILQLTSNPPGFLQMHPHNKLTEPEDRIVNNAQPILEINYPKKEKLTTEDRIVYMPYAPESLNIYEANVEKNPDYPINIPFKENSLYPDVIHTLYTTNSKSNDVKSPNKIPSAYDSSPGFSPVVTGDVNKGYSVVEQDSSFLPFEIDVVKDRVPHNQPIQPSEVESVSEEFDQSIKIHEKIPLKETDDDLGENDIGQSRPIPIYVFDLPSKRPHMYIGETPKEEISPLQNYDPDHDSIDQSKNIPTFLLEQIQNPSPVPFDVIGDGSGEVSLSQNIPNPVFDDSRETDIDQNRPIPIYEFDLPPKRPKIYTGETPKEQLSPLQYYDPDYINIDQNKNIPTFLLEPIQNPSHEPFDVFGDGSGEVSLSQNIPSPLFDLPAKRPDSSSEIDWSFPSSTSSITTHSPFFIDSAHNPVIRPSYPLDKIFNTGNKKEPSNPSNQYDKSPNSIPSINGRPKFTPNIPPGFVDSDSEEGRAETPYLPKFPSEYYLLTKKPSLIQPFEDLGDGSGEALMKTSPEPLIDVLMDSNHPQQLNYKPDYLSDSNFPNGEYVINPYSPQPEYLDDSKNPDFDINTPENLYLPEKNNKNKISIKQLISLYPHLINQHPNNQKEMLPSVPELSHSPDKNNLFPGEHVNDNENGIFPLSQENDIISESVTFHTPNLQIENQYYSPDQIKMPYEPISDIEELSHEYTDLYSTDKPIIWENENYLDIPNIHLPEFNYPSAPDKKVLVIIKDNIEVIEHKIPKFYLDSVIREHIKIIKGLMKLKEITIEEYITILNQYEVLIEYIKHSNIDNAILKELLLSMTNGGNLDLKIGKPKVVELTYLIKRPTPLVYQPFYYIKYRLPYTSFVNRMETILASRPHLSKYPSQLYKSLIPVSKVAETSPDLESYNKDDIVRLTFDNGTLVGTKFIKGRDTDMYAALNMLKEINDDFTIDDIYKLIKNLDVQLQMSKNDDLLYIPGIRPSTFSNNIDNLKLQLEPDNGVDNNMIDRITVKVNKIPTITKKITKITTKKVTSDRIIEDILNQVNNLRSNTDESKKQVFEKYNTNIHEPSLESIQKKVQDTNNLVKINSSDESIEDSNNEINGDRNENILKENRLAFDYIPMYSDNSNEHINHLNKMDTTAIDDTSSKETLIMNKPILYLKADEGQSSLSMYEKLLEATKNADKITNSKSDILQPINSAYISDGVQFVDSPRNTQIYEENSSSTGAKLLDATLAHNFEQANNQNSKYDSAFLPENSMYTNNNPNILDSHQIESSDMYVSNSLQYVDSPLQPQTYGKDYSPIGAKLLDATVKAQNYQQADNQNSNYDSGFLASDNLIYTNANPNIQNSHGIESPKISNSDGLEIVDSIQTYGQNHYPIGAKLLDATLEAHNFDQAVSQNSNGNSAFLTSDNSIYTNTNPNIYNSQQIKDLKIPNQSNYNIANPDLIKKTTVYSVESTANNFPNFDTYNHANMISPDSMKVSQGYVIGSPNYLANHNKIYPMDNLNRYAPHTMYQTYSNPNPGYFFNRNPRLLKNNYLRPSIQNYQNIRADPYTFYPPMPMRTG